MLESVQKLTEEFVEKDKAFLKDTEVLIRECFSEFFEKHSIAKSISWAQYIPSYADSEFNIYDSELRLIPSYEETILEANDKLNKKLGYCYGTNCAFSLLEGASEDLKIQSVFEDYDNLQYLFELEHSFKEIFRTYVLMIASKDGIKVTDFYGKDY